MIGRIGCPVQPRRSFEMSILQSSVVGQGRGCLERPSNFFFLRIKFALKIITKGPRFTQKLPFDTARPVPSLSNGIFVNRQLNVAPPPISQIIPPDQSKSPYRPKY